MWVATVTPFCELWGQTGIQLNAGNTGLLRQMGTGLLIAELSGFGINGVPGDYLGDTIQRPAEEIGNRRPA